MTRIVVAGGGIAGLAIAFAVKKLDPRAEVVVLERGSRTGGNIRTETIDGYTCESGPDGFLDNAAPTVRLVHDLGLDSRLQRSCAAARRRFIVRRGRLCPVPTSALSFLTSRVLSPRGKLRVLLEPFAGRRMEEDESIHSFATRRIGVEAAERLVGSMVSGIFAGDARALSLGACFPRMRQMEDEHGGLVRAMLATRRERRATGAIGMPAGRLTSFTGGMTELIDALTRALSGNIRTSCGVRALAKRTGAGGYELTAGGDTIHADAVVLAGPAPETAAIVAACDSVLAGLVEGIPAAPLAVVCLGYSTAALATASPRDGFGFLVPRSEPFTILGALWESSIYPGRAPEGKTLMRVMIGGARDPGAVTMEDGRLLAIVQRDLAAIMRIGVTPEFVRIIRHSRGIPQYVRGHTARLRDIDARLQALPGLFLAGNSYRGVSINSCVADAPVLAARALDHIAARRGAGAFSAA